VWTGLCSTVAVLVLVGMGGATSQKDKGSIVSSRVAMTFLAELFFKYLIRID